MDPRDVAEQALQKLEHGALLGTGLHNAIWRQTPMVAVEVVCFKGFEGDDYVLLAQRGVDEAYAGKLHSLGTIARASDGSIEEIIGRLNESEFGGMMRLRFLPSHSPIWYGREERGMMFSLLFLGRIVGVPPKGDWYPVEGVISGEVEGVIPFHREVLIPAAYKMLGCLRFSLEDSMGGHPG